MLSACLVGKLVDEQEEMAEEKKKKDEDGFAKPNSLPSAKPGKVITIFIVNILLLGCGFLSMYYYYLRIR